MLCCETQLKLLIAESLSPYNSMIEQNLLPNHFLLTIRSDAIQHFDARKSFLHSVLKALDELTQSSIWLNLKRGVVKRSCADCFKEKSSNPTLKEFLNTDYSPLKKPYPKCNTHPDSDLLQPHDQIDEGGKIQFTFSNVF